MDLVNIGRSRRFLRERPIRVTLFDRPRLVCDLICLETEQTEKRRGLDTSDSLYVVIEGNARLRSGQQIEELEAQDAALIPPGVDHTIENLGPGRLTVMVVVTPKPSRAGEVRMPAQGGFRPVEEDASSRERPSREEGEDRPSQDRPPSRSYNREAQAGPPRGRPYNREGDSRRSGGRPYRRDDSGPPRGGSYNREGDSRPSDGRPFRRDDSGPPRGRPYRARDDSRGAPSRDGGPRRDAPSDGPRAGARGAGRQEGPVWFPRPKQSSWRPRGAPPAGGRGGYRSAAGPSRDRNGPLPAPGGRNARDRDERESLPDESPRRRSGFNGSPPAAAGRGRTGTGGRGGSTGGPPRGRSGPSSRGGGGRGASGPARRPTGRPAPGRNGSRTSGRRRSPES
jgi:translation initiation factor IF-2